MPFHSFKVISSIAAYRIVGHAGTADRAELPTSTATPLLGVTIAKSNKATQYIPVAGPGEIAKVLFNDSVVSGGLLTADSSGRGVPFTPATVAAYCIGILLGAKVNDTGVVADILVLPQFMTQDS